GVVTGAVGSANHDGDCRHRGVGDGVDQLGAVADNALFLVRASHHEAGNVLQKKQRDVLLVTKLNKLRAFTGRLRHQDPVVAKNADRESVDAGETSYQRGTVFRLEFGKPAAIDDARDDIANLEGNADIGRSNPQQFVGVIKGLLGRTEVGYSRLGAIE